jgi:hypothetical protein
LKKLKKIRKIVIMGNWAEEVNLKIDKSLETSKDKDIRFFRIDEFKRNIVRVHEFSSQCGFCQKQKININDAAKNINEAVEIPGKTRRDYDRLISQLSRHMRKEHGFYPPFYFSYVYAFYGFLGGLVFGFLLAQIFPGLTEVMYAASFVVFIVGTYIIGSIKDSKIRIQKRIM